VTFSELFDAVHGGNPSMQDIDTAVRQIIWLSRDMYDCWIEYKQARLGREA
jgi:hypothetical protein